MFNVYEMTLKKKNCLSNRLYYQLVDIGIFCKLICKILYSLEYSLNHNKKNSNWNFRTLKPTIFINKLLFVFNTAFPCPFLAVPHASLLIYFTYAYVKARTEV